MFHVKPWNFPNAGEGIEARRDALHGDEAVVRPERL
jgi:hypothetical protein